MAENLHKLVALIIELHVGILLRHNNLDSILSMGSVICMCLCYGNEYRKEDRIHVCNLKMYMYLTHTFHQQSFHNINDPYCTNSSLIMGALFSLDRN